MSNARIYLVTLSESTHLVKAASQAQAIRRVARDLMSCRPAHSLEVAELMAAGAPVLDAADTYEPEAPHADTRY